MCGCCAFGDGEVLVGVDADGPLAVAAASTALEQTEPDLPAAW